MFRFMLGLVTGIIVGVAAASLSSGQGGIDLRAEFERIRSDVEKRDFEALGAHLEERFKELQANLDKRFAEASDVAAGATDDVAETVEDAADAVQESAKA